MKYLYHIVIAILIVSLPIVSKASVPDLSEFEELQENDEPTEPEKQPTFQELLREAFRLGEHDPNWNHNVFDIEAHIRTLPGGARRNFVLSTGPHGVSGLAFLDSDVGISHIPADWVLIAESRRATDDQADGVSIIPIDSRYFVVAFGEDRTSNGIPCGVAETTLLYERPDGESDFSADEIMVVFDTIYSLARQMVVCARLDEIEPGRWIETYYSEDGRPFVSLNEDSIVIEIVPAGDIEVLLGLE